MVLPVTHLQGGRCKDTSLSCTVRGSEGAKPIDAVRRCPWATSQEEERLSLCKLSPAPRKVPARLALLPLSTCKGQQALVVPRECWPEPCADSSPASAAAASPGAVLLPCRASGRSCSEASPVLSEYDHALPGLLDPAVPGASCP